MAGILQELLQAKEPLFSLAIRQLEQASRQEGRDARLIGEIAQKFHANIATLGLDPSETSGRELYAALQVRVAADDERLAKKIGGEYASDVDHMNPLIVKAVKTLVPIRDCWVLKRSVAKKMLKKMPPKQLMKSLSYRSIDSLLKHENMDEVYVALRFSEGQAWLDKFNAALSEVTSADFELRKLNLVVLPRKYADLAQNFVAKKWHHVVHAKEFGVVAVAPLKADRMQGVTLKTMLLLLHYIGEVYLYSTYFKLKQVQPDFGEVVADMVQADPNNAVQMAGQYVHWRVVQRYFGKHDEASPELFQPHVQPEDLRWRESEESLAVFDTEMSFWLDQSYVGKMIDGKPLTFNLIDAAFNYAEAKPYEEAYFYHFRESLWNELFTRYMGAENLRKSVLNQLDTPMIAPEEMDV